MVGAAGLLCMHTRCIAFIARSDAQPRRYPFSPHMVIPEGVSLSGTSCRKVLGGPRSALRFGGDDGAGLSPLPKGRGECAQIKTYPPLIKPPIT